MNRRYIFKNMYCKYSREALEMYCILSRYFEMGLCWNIEERMKRCKFFTDVSKDKWLEVQNKSDYEFLREENITNNLCTKEEVKEQCKQKMKHITF